MSTTRHMRFSVRGALLRTDRELGKTWGGCITNDAGVVLNTGREIKSFLMDQLALGREYLPSEDRARLDWMHDQLCAVHQHASCGPVEVHHDTQDGARGKKAGHERGIPMCSQAHRDFHGNCGVFKGWTRDLLRTWQTAQVCYFQKLWTELKSFLQSIPV